eukprot:Tbor_TRINITY_DN3447_c0_g1::TRINITY_DN3447_c0_g1_i1::g.3693::m.3693
MSVMTPVCSSGYMSSNCRCYSTTPCQTTTTTMIPREPISNNDRVREVQQENIKKIEELEALQELVNRARKELGEGARQARKREKARKEHERARITALTQNLHILENAVKQKKEAFNTYSLTLEKCETAKFAAQETVNKLLRQNETLSFEVQKLQKTLDRKNKVTAAIQSEVSNFRCRLEEVRNEEKNNNIEASILDKKTIQIMNMKDKLEKENRRKDREFDDMKKKPLEYFEEIQSKINQLRDDNMSMTKILLAKNIPLFRTSEAEEMLRNKTPTPSLKEMISRQVESANCCTCDDSQRNRIMEKSMKYDDLCETIRETAAKASSQLEACQC